jgi:hypothetical protein
MTLGLAFWVIADLACAWFLIHFTLSAVYAGANRAAVVCVVHIVGLVGSSAPQSINSAFRIGAISSWH